MPTEASIINNLKKQFLTKNKDIVLGIGDDAAIIKPNIHTELVYTCDSQVEGTHFLTTQISPKQLGFRAMSAAVSDLAAMGASPKYCLVSLFLPKRPDIDTWIKGINQGIKQAGTYYDIAIIGGNIAKSSVLSIDIFAVGEVQRGKAIRQDGAKVGDTVMVTGTLGNAHTGWRLLQNQKIDISEKDKAYLFKSHFVPKAHVKEGQVFASTEKVSAMIDISDGLSTDLLHLCEASNVGVRIFSDALPLGIHVRNFAKKTQIEPSQLALQGGEDYQLLFTVSPKYVEEVLQLVKEKTGTRITSIGTIEKKSKGRKIILSQGETLPLTAQGFDHMR